MSSQQVTTILTYSVLALAGVISFILPQSLINNSKAAQAGGPPDSISVAGTIRDFLSSHPDFDTTPLLGSGHYNGNLAYNLDAYNKPVFTGNGFKVASNWKDSLGRAIAPHLYKEAALFDTGGTNLLLILADPSTMTAGEIATQALLESWGYDVTVIDDSAGVAEIDAQVAANDVAFVTPRADDNELKPNLVDAPIGFVNSNLKVRKKFGWPTGSNNTTSTEIDVDNNSHYLTETFSTGKLVLFTSAQEMSATNDPIPGGSTMLGSKTGASKKPILQVLNPGDALWNANLCCAPARRVQLPWGKTDFDITSLTNDGMTLLRRSLQWAAGAGNNEAPCIVIADTSGTIASPSKGGITSAATFDQWFRDVLGVNLSTFRRLTLTNDGTGIYEFLSNDYHPIDGELLGNEGLSYNYFLTYEISAEFVYNQCTDQFVEFGGTNDAWLFIDGKLVLDAGGTGDSSIQYLELDRLGLVDGRTYNFKFFYAQRQAMQSILNLRTNLLLSSDGVIPSVTAAFD